MRVRVKVRVKVRFRVTVRVRFMVVWCGVVWCVCVRVSGGERVSDGE